MTSWHCVLPMVHRPVTVLSRAHNFLGILETDPELARLAVEPHTYLAVALASSLLPCSTSPRVRDHFPTTGPVAAMKDAEAFLAEACWGPAVARVTALQVCRRPRSLLPRLHLARVECVHALLLWSCGFFCRELSS